MIIAVIGGNNADTAALAGAEAVGRCIAEAGHALICGGLGGVMEAACRGAREAGGRTVGVLPGPDAAAANPYVDIPIVTNMGVARNAIIVQTAGAVIAIDGSYGTLSEIAIALNVGRPVIGVGTWRFSDGHGDADTVIRTDDPAEAVRLAVEAAESIKAGAAL